MLPSEENVDPNTSENPKRWDLALLEGSFDVAAGSLNPILTQLEGIVSAIPPGALSKDPVEAGDLSGVDYDAIRTILVELSYFGTTGAFPKNAILPELSLEPSEEEDLALLRARQSLIEQAILTLAQGRNRHSQAVAMRTFSGLTPEEIIRLSAEEKAEIYQRAGALVLGDSFRFVPTFSFKNRPSWTQRTVSRMMSLPIKACCVSRRVDCSPVPPVRKLMIGVHWPSKSGWRELPRFAKISDLIDAVTTFRKRSPVEVWYFDHFNYLSIKTRIGSHWSFPKYRRINSTIQPDSCPREIFCHSCVSCRRTTTPHNRKRVY